MASISGEQDTWEAFGKAVSDYVISIDEQQIAVNVDWKQATWGVGCKARVDPNIDATGAQEIRFTAWIDNASETKVYLGIETADGAHLSYPASRAKPLSSKPKEFRFPLAEMTRLKPASPKDDLNEIDAPLVYQAKILFTKPKTRDPAFDVIHISKPKLMNTEARSSKAKRRANKKTTLIGWPILRKKPSSQNAPLPATEKTTAKNPAPVNTELQLPSKNFAMASSTVTGAGVKDWGTVENQDQMFVAVKWSQSAEGVAIRFKLPQLPPSQLPEILKLDVRTAYDSRSEIRMRVTSDSGKIVYQDPKWRPKITANWREYEFNLSDSVDEKSFSKDGDTPSGFIEILVRKPVKTIPDHELILVRNPRFVESDLSQNTLTKKKSSQEDKEEETNLVQLLGKSFAIRGSYTYDYSYNASGGIASGSSNRSFIDVGLTVDLQSALNWENGTAAIGFQKYSGDNASDLVGDYQGTGGNDTDDVEILSELWIERFFMEDTLRVKVGKIDANSEFAYVNNGAEFVNASYLFSPTISVLTTTPNTAVGTNLFFYPYENVYGGFGVYDGATQLGRSTGKSGLDSIFRSPGSLFFIAEVGGSWSSEKDQLPGRLGLGVWRHNANFERFDGGVENGAEGYYIVFDKTVWERNVNSNDQRQSLDTFLQYGYASGSISEVEQHIGFGLVVSNPLGSRTEDVSGFGLTWVDFTDEPAAGFDEPAELVIECFYKIQFNPFLSIKPDLQYVIDPGGNANLDNAFVPGLRVDASF